MSIINLGRTTRTNMVFYSTDGMGRDGYITYNDGGFWKDNIKKISLKPDYPRYKYKIFHSLIHKPAPFTYQSDGSGRDSYVIENNGGLVKEFQPLIKQKLTKFLRKYDNNNDYIKRTIYMTKSQKNYFNKIQKIQRNVVRRLYNESLEKIKNKKRILNSKSISTFLNNNSMRNNFENISSIKSYQDKEKFYNKKIENDDKFINPLNNNGQKNLFDRILKKRIMHQNKSMKNFDNFNKKDNTDKVKILKNLNMNPNYDYNIFNNNTAIYNNEKKNKFNKINYYKKANNKSYNVVVGPDDLKNNNLISYINNIPKNTYNNKIINDNVDIKNYDNKKIKFFKKYEDKNEDINNKMNNTDYFPSFNRTQILGNHKPFLMDDHKDYRESYKNYMKNKNYVI